MTDLKFLGVNFPSELVKKQADPSTDRLLVDTIGPSGGSAPLVIKPVTAVTGTSPVLLVKDGPADATLLSVAGNGNIDVAKPWSDNASVSWSTAVRLVPSTAPANGTPGSVHLAVGSGVDPTTGAGTEGVENPPAGSLLLQTTGDAPWAKTGAGATDWSQLAYTTSSGKRYATVVVGNVLKGDDLTNCDFLDPGDGSGIAAAIQLISELGGDIVVRSGEYDLNYGSVTLPINIPSGTVLKGAGVGLTTIRACSTDSGFGTSMSVFTLAGTLLDISLIVDVPSFPNPGVDNYLIDVQSTGVVRRVTTTLSGLGQGGYADFGALTHIFNFTNGSILEDCNILSSVSFTADGAGYTLTGFYGTGTDNGDVFRIDRCSCWGADIGFLSMFGPGYFSSCTTTNSEVAAFTVMAGTAVKILEPHSVWLSNPAPTSVLYSGVVLDSSSDCAVSGGDFITPSGVTTGYAVSFLFGGGQAPPTNRNKIHGVTFSGWSTGTDFVTSGGVAFGNSVQLCVFSGVGMVIYSTDGNDTGTVIDNNIIDTAGQQILQWQ